jgi:hypothetical protein
MGLSGLTGGGRSVDRRDEVEDAMGDGANDEAVWRVRAMTKVTTM